ncbi:polysaccharide pyruvyl transferase family protein [Myroides odoratimimus]|uniref:polysaccharide pyruvyl transferase family protein n=1 Tax=Myroides odoratimimus TaxID=76832 RepID=UPI0025778513|nr:polysaccharide pyruvyl transferase family protein [Myroides odoratimimus]MDM1060597.1 polysaccharide pyruvyl transferase family protein [Myroides odoratimimus]
MRKKKIGVLTLPIKENYGGVIQAVALYDIIGKLGYDCYLINKRYNESYLKRLLRFVCSHNPLYFLYDFNSLTSRHYQSKDLRMFIKNFFDKKTNYIYNTSDFINVCNKFDSLVVGSDQVWRYKYTRNNYSNYFFKGVSKNVKKISYAASFGVNLWEGDKDTIEDIKKLLIDFNAISVREDSGLDILEKCFSISSGIHVLDPTLLHTKDFYESLIDSKDKIGNVELFNYVLDNSVVSDKIIDDVSEYTGYSVSKIELQQQGLVRNVSMESWLSHFKNSEYIITDSFHGVVFSIIFNRQFICIGNKARGVDRFLSLLKLLDLEERIILDYDDKNVKELLGKEIDYSHVNLKLNYYRERSLKYLSDNLN